MYKYIPTAIIMNKEAGKEKYNIFCYIVRDVTLRKIEKVVSLL